MKLKHYLSILAIAAVVASCSKGDTGPQGPPGANGVANLSVWNYTVPFNDWLSYNSNTWYYVTGVSLPTTDVVNVYVSLNGATYTPLATSSFFTSGDNLTFVYGNSGNVTLWEYFNSIGPNVSVYVQIADIPPAINAKYPKVNWNNYSEVSALPEYKAALTKIK